MKVKILLALLCAMSLQTQAFFGSQMLSTAWKATASFCKEHPIAVATVAAACGISYWLYKKYTKTSSAVFSSHLRFSERVQDIIYVMEDGEITFEEVIFKNFDASYINVLLDGRKSNYSYMYIGQMNGWQDWQRGRQEFKIFFNGKNIGMILYDIKKIDESENNFIEIKMLILYEEYQKNEYLIEAIYQKIDEASYEKTLIQSIYVQASLRGIEPEAYERQRALYVDFGLYAKIYPSGYVSQKIYKRTLTWSFD